MTEQGQKMVRTSALALLLAVVLALPWMLSWTDAPVYWRGIFIKIALMILATSSMRAIFRTGELSLGTAGFLLLGGYGAALLSTKLGLSPWLTIFLGGLIAAAVAALVAYPFFRIKGVYFVITTLLLAFILLYLAGYFVRLTGGWQGFQFFEISPKIPTKWGTLGFTSKTNIEYYYLTALVVGICLFVLYRMERSRIGLTWKSIREADNLAQSVGVNIMGQKIFIFVVACFFTGLAGGLYAFHVHALSPTPTPGNWFHFFTSVYCLLYMVVGGVGSFWGPLIGVTLFMYVREHARPLQEWWPMVIGGLLIVIIFFMPKGLAALPEYLPEWYRKSRGLFRRRASSSS